MPDFIVDNQILFIVLGVLVIMAIIGYVADKNNMIKKEKTSKKEKNESIPVQENETEKTMLIQENENNEANKIEEVDHNIDFDSSTNEIDNTVVLEPMITSETYDDLTVQIEGLQNQQDIETVASELGVDPAILTTPLEGSSSEDDFGIDNVPPLHIDNTSNKDASDDVWKF